MQYSTSVLDKYLAPSNFASFILGTKTFVLYPEDKNSLPKPRHSSVVTLGENEPAIKPPSFLTCNKMAISDRNAPPSKTCDLFS